MKTEFKEGDLVNYHSIKGGSITSQNHIVTAVETMPNNYGCDVAWISDKSSCVAVESLSHVLEEITSC